MGKRVLLVLSLAATGIMAQPIPPGQAFTCVANAGTPVIVRVEGLTELVGDLLVQCKGGTPTPLGQPVPTANVRLSLNTGITNRIFPGGGGFVDALLLIDEPTVANQVVSPYDPITGSSFPGTVLGTGTGVNFAGGQAPNVYVGETTSVQSANWEILVDPSASETGEFGFGIYNVHVDAADLYSASPGVPLQAIIGGLGFPFVTATLPVPQPSLAVGVVPGAASQDFSLNISLTGPNPSLPIPKFNPPKVQYSELLPTAFKPRVAAPVTSTFSNPAPIDPTIRLRGVFSNIPPGVRLFVSTNNVTGLSGQLEPRAGTTSGPQATLYSGGTAAGNTGLSELKVTNGTATAVWQVNSDSGTVADTFTFDVYPEFFSGGTTATAPPAPTNINVAMSYDSEPGGLQFTGPAGPPMTIFTINEFGSTSQLSAMVDSRPCLIGEPYPDPANACSPGNNPQIVISSDTAPLTPLFSAATAGGVNITGKFTAGSTPVDGTLTVTAPGATPGTYQQTFNITAAGSANSLALPYSVTVLPPNNPFIKPGGVVDAFSFAGGSVAPGQIFALFGSNFGPSSGLVSGTVNASGVVGTTISNTQVLFDGVAAPLLYVTQNQLAGVVPYEIRGKASTNVQVVYNNVKSPALAVPVSATSLSIASYDGSGGGGGVIINKDGTVNSATNRASVGDTVVIYAAYAGPFANSITGTDGRTTTSAPYPAPAGPIGVKVGGVAATSIPYFGNVPTLLESVMQINVVIPPGAPSGATVPLTLTTGSATTNPGITIAVK